MNFARLSFLLIRLAAPTLREQPRLEQFPRTCGSASPPIWHRVVEFPCLTKKLQVTRAGLSSDSFDDSPHSPCASADWIAWRGHQLRRRIQSFRAAHLFPDHFLFHFDSPAEPAAK